MLWHLCMIPSLKKAVCVLREDFLDIILWAVNLVLWHLIVPLNGMTPGAWPMGEQPSGPTPACCFLLRAPCLPLPLPLSYGSPQEGALEIEEGRGWGCKGEDLQLSPWSQERCGRVPRRSLFCTPERVLWPSCLQTKRGPEFSL